jgi:hypothetical protein
LPLVRSFAGEGAGEGSALSQTCNRDSSSAATKTASKPKSNVLSEETYQTIRNALLAPNQFTPHPEAAAPPVENLPARAEPPQTRSRQLLSPRKPLLSQSNQSPKP